MDNIELLENRIPKKLTESQLDMLAGIISDKYESWEEACEEHRREERKIQQYIYQSQKGEHKKGDNFVLPAIYKLNGAIKAHIKENVYATNSGVFDVKGDDEESQKNANLHKWDIVKDLEKIDFKNIKVKELLKNYMEAGEMIAFVGLNTVTKKRKTEVKVPETIIGLSGEEIRTEVMKLGLEEIEVYSGIDVFTIKSRDFVFDTTKADRFDSPVCGKIIRKWLVYDEIVDNKAYDLLHKGKYGNSVKEYLKESIKNEEPSFDLLRTDRTLLESRRKVFDGDQAELLMYWGDIIVDGIELKDYLIVLAGNRVIRCEPNPYYGNTIVYYAREVHPDYKRGISGLRVALRSADVASNIANEIITAFPYIANPSAYISKGGIVNKKYNVPPGGFIEYDTDLNKNAPIVKDVTGVLKGFDLIQFFENQTEGAVGLTNAMLGQETEEKKPATEIKAMQIGGSIRMSDEIDGLKQGFNIPLIRKIADVKANFEDGDMPIGVTQGDGGVKSEVITNEVRRGRYQYTYIDSKDTMERQARLRDLIKALQLILGVSPNILDLKEVSKHIILETGYQNVEKFLNKDILEEGIRQVLKGMQVGDRPEAMEFAKEKIVQYLPEIVKRIIEDEQSKAAEQAIYERGMGAMPSNISGQGIQNGGVSRASGLDRDENYYRNA